MRSGLQTRVVYICIPHIIYIYKQFIIINYISQKHVFCWKTAVNETIIVGTNACLLVI